MILCPKRLRLGNREIERFGGRRKMMKMNSNFLATILAEKQVKIILELDDLLENVFFSGAKPFRVIKVVRVDVMI